MMYSKQMVRINTKITSEETLVKMAQPIVDFAEKHDVSIQFGYDADGAFMASYAANGITSAYCKGMMAEIKQMLKDTFHCKIEVLFYAY